MNRLALIEAARVTLLASAPAASRGMLFTKAGRLKAEARDWFLIQIDAGKPLDVAIPGTYERMTGIRVLFPPSN